jgi:hypothetical protein
LFSKKDPNPYAFVGKAGCLSLERLGRASSVRKNLLVRLENPAQVIFEKAILHISNLLKFRAMTGAVVFGTSLAAAKFQEMHVSPKGGETA